MNPGPEADALYLDEIVELVQPEIEWRKMYGLRNIVADHYRRPNYRILWQIATETLDPLDKACRDELARLDE
ncbi:MAG TPA: HepT-like ribonuclease domain-containing protein [Allosphingosinicella sp.]|jgi:uncharacterized protein with HEPN domain